MAVTRDSGEEGTGSYCLMGTEFQFSKLKRVLGMDDVKDCTVSLYLIPLTHTLKNGYSNELNVKCIMP